MSWRTNRLVVGFRNIGRRCGLNTFLMSFGRPSSYESKFNEALLAGIKKGDIVWDVGANVGHYTKLFASLTGPRGKVYAFEPSPRNYAELTRNLTDVRNVILSSCALGDKDGTAVFKQGSDALGATSQVWGAPASGGECIQVRIRAGDLLVRESGARSPNFVKIDVEGFELEVLSGMSAILDSRELRGLGIEVHFGLLAERGMSWAPEKIEVLLMRAGFACSWPDSSHILAIRPN